MNEFEFAAQTSLRLVKVTLFLCRDAQAYVDWIWDFELCLAAIKR